MPLPETFGGMAILMRTGKRRSAKVIIPRGLPGIFVPFSFWARIAHTRAAVSSRLGLLRQGRLGMRSITRNARGVLGAAEVRDAGQGLSVAVDARSLARI